MCPVQGKEIEKNTRHSLQVCAPSYEQVLTTLTAKKAAELVITMDEDKSAAVLYELAQEPYNKEEHSPALRSFLLAPWRHGGSAADILSLVEPLLARSILAKFPEQEWAGAVLREMVRSKNLVLWNFWKILLCALIFADTLISLDH